MCNQTIKTYISGLFLRESPFFLTIIKKSPLYDKNRENCLRTQFFILTFASVKVDCMLLCMASSAELLTGGREMLDVAQQT